MWLGSLLRDRMEGRLTSTMIESFAFIDSCNFIDPPLQGARFT